MDNCINGAVFKDDNRHRLALWRIWDDSKPLFMYVGLNPSTANETGDDPTIRRLYTLTANNGGGGFFMHNLFTLVSAHPEVLYDKEISELVHPEYADLLASQRRSCKVVVFCWSNIADRPQLQWRTKYFTDLYGADAMCFGKNKGGSPKHPLYLKSTTPHSKFMDL